jgi:hypothetical protein
MHIIGKFNAVIIYAEISAAESGDVFLADYMGFFFRREGLIHRCQLIWRIIVADKTACACR